MMPLLHALAEVPDFRKSQGKRHPLPALLGLICAAMLSGFLTPKAIAQWGQAQAQTTLQRLGFTRPHAPSESTLQRILRSLDASALEQTLTRWLRRWLPAHGELALDGKTLRGSSDGALPATQLLAAFCQQAGAVLAQQPVQQRDESEAAQALLQGLDLTGWIVTADAGLGHKALAQTILAQGGAYVFTIKGNQPTVRDDLALLCGHAREMPRDPEGSLRLTSATTVQLHGGRVERRTLWASDVLVGYTPWPGLGQVFQLERQVTHKATDELRQEVTYGVTSLSPERASAGRLLALVQGHWGIENRSHWVRDVRLAEDRCRVRKGSGPQMLAAFRNLGLTLLRRVGFGNMAQGLQHFALRPEAAIRLVTHPLPKPPNKKMT